MNNKAWIVNKIILLKIHLQRAGVDESGICDFMKHRFIFWRPLYGTNFSESINYRLVVIVSCGMNGEKHLIQICPDPG